MAPIEEENGEVETADADGLCQPWSDQFETLGQFGQLYAMLHTHRWGRGHEDARDDDNGIMHKMNVMMTTVFCQLSMPAHHIIRSLPFSHPPFVFASQNTYSASLLHLFIVSPAYFAKNSLSSYLCPPHQARTIQMSQQQRRADDEVRLGAKMATPIALIKIPPTLAKAWGDSFSESGKHLGTLSGSLESGAVLTVPTADRELRFVVNLKSDHVKSRVISADIGEHGSNVRFEGVVTTLGTLNPPSLKDTAYLSSLKKNVIAQAERPHEVKNLGQKELAKINADVAATLNAKRSQMSDDESSSSDDDDEKPKVSAIHITLHLHLSRFEHPKIKSTNAQHYFQSRTTVQQQRPNPIRHLPNQSQRRRRST